jgi:hypothetical protein
MKPTGDCLLEVDFAQIWADIDDPDGAPFIRSCDRDSTEFKKRLRQLSPKVRDSLHASWFLQFTPRDEGGRGLYVLDDLWYVWSQHVNNGADLGTLLKLGTHPVRYLAELYFTLFPVQFGPRDAKSERGLIRKINRHLPEHEKLHKARPHLQWAVGTYYVVDHNTNTIVAKHIEDLDRFFCDLMLPYLSRPYVPTRPTPDA